MGEYTGPIKTERLSKLTLTPITRLRVVESWLKVAISSPATASYGLTARCGLSFLTAPNLKKCRLQTPIPLAAWRFWDRSTRQRLLWPWQTERRRRLALTCFLIVYPEANDKFPQPVMGRGSLQALWEAERARVTFFQADITLAEGFIPDGRVVNGNPTNTDTVSGGALVNQQGDLIGISVPIPHRERVSLAASASDIAPIVEWLISGETRPELGDRRLPSSGEQFEFSFETRDDWDRHWRGDTSYCRRFLVHEPVLDFVQKLDKL